MASTSDRPDRPSDPPAAVDDRLELERGLRTALLAVEELRSDVLRLAAQVVAQGEALTRLVAAGGDAAAAAHEDTVAARADELATVIAARDVTNVLHVELAPPVDKYAAGTSSPPCAELLPICGARCCRLPFALSSQDLDEGVVRWDHGRPYLIRHEADGACTHLDRAAGGGCTVYAHRPAPCRSYDCRHDPRVWIDYDRRVPAPLEAIGRPASAAELADLGPERRAGLAAELVTLRLRR
ncbi:MAG TPA: YkgJ family cysteine cluster protein [Kofleriaceae bacterium]|nr:YkgJ family cysteine cluster protein [Kofleriaceae bacterium]